MGWLTNMFSWVTESFGGDSFVDAAVGAAGGALVAKATGNSALKGALIGGGLNYASGAGLLGEGLQSFTRGISGDVSDFFRGSSSGGGSAGLNYPGDNDVYASTGGGVRHSDIGYDGGGGGGETVTINTTGDFAGGDLGYGYDPYYEDRLPTATATSGFSGGSSNVGLSGEDTARYGGSYTGAPTTSASRRPSGSFSDRLKAGLTNPEILLKGGLALGAGLTGSGGKQGSAALSDFNARQAAIDAENRGIRLRQNATADNIEASGGINAYKQALVRGGREVESLQQRLGYTGATSAAKESLTNRARQQAGLNAQTAYVQGDTAGRTQAAALRKEAPGASTAGLQYAQTQDSDNDTRNTAMWGGIGRLTEDIFGYGEESRRRREEEESARRRAGAPNEGGR